MVEEKRGYLENAEQLHPVEAAIAKEEFKEITRYL